MKPSLWKKSLSYFSEFHIESAPSDINPHLYVSLKNGRYQLCTENAIYSYGDLYDNFRRAFRALKWEAYKIEKILILGFGLGSIPVILEKMGKSFHFAAVEIDENILYLFNKYVKSDIKSSIEFYQADASHFVSICNEKFDLVCVDVFQDDVIPYEIQSNSFLVGLKDILTSNGIVLYNRLSRTKQDRKLSGEYFRDVFKAEFPEGTYLDVQGNWILTNRSDIFR